MVICNGNDKRGEIIRKKISVIGDGNDHHHHIKHIILYMMAV